MVVNTGLLQRVTDEIRKGTFRWSQSTWVDSDPVPAGLSVNRFDNECNTSYCFAGRVASLNRELLYRDYFGEFEVLEHLVALDTDDLMRTYHTDTWDETQYRAVNRDGTIVFEPYQGYVISARSAAISDLGIDNDTAYDLFDADNSIGTIQNIVDGLVSDNA